MKKIFVFSTLIIQMVGFIFMFFYIFTNTNFNYIITYSLLIFFALFILSSLYVLKKVNNYIYLYSFYLYSLLNIISFSFDNTGITFHNGLGISIFHNFDSNITSFYIHFFKWEYGLGETKDYIQINFIYILIAYLIKNDKLKDNNL